MFSSRRVALALFLSVIVAGCASSGSNSESNAGVRRDVLTREQILATNARTVYEAIDALRSNWLRPRGVDTFIGTPGRVQAYVDTIRQPDGVESLRDVHVNDVEYVQYFDGIAATGRWGLDHGHGAIVVVTR